MKKYSCFDIKITLFVQYHLQMNAIWARFNEKRRLSQAWPFFLGMKEGTYPKRFPDWLASENNRTFLRKYCHARINYTISHQYETLLDSFNSQPTDQN